MYSSMGSSAFTRIPESWRRISSAMAMLWERNAICSFSHASRAVLLTRKVTWCTGST